ncbi:MAG TPA: aldolase/citrate lyase family protein [Burkholderiales bacterium]|nr:aldolase/citrate lyase family protein [Burkholderiales bacterium]
MTKNDRRRRSWLIVPAHDAGSSGDVRPDVRILDLEYSVPPRAKEAAREGLKSLAASLAASGSDVFVRIERETRWADAAAAIGRGVAGIVFPGPEDAGEVSELSALIDQKEKERGVDAGSTEIVVMLESAQGFRDAAAIAQASPRVTALGVGRIDLTMRLGPVPQGEFRFYRFLMTRAVVAARMLGKQPLGALWRPGSRGGVASPQATAQAAREGRLMGFSGCLCATPDQVAAVNEGYGA